MPIATMYWWPFFTAGPSSFTVSTPRCVPFGAAAGNPPAALAPCCAAAIRAMENRRKKLPADLQIDMLKSLLKPCFPANSAVEWHHATTSRQPVACRLSPVARGIAGHLVTTSFQPLNTLAPVPSFLPTPQLLAGKLPATGYRLSFAAILQLKSLLFRPTPTQSARIPDQHVHSHPSHPLLPRSLLCRLRARRYGPQPAGRSTVRPG